VTHHSRGGEAFPFPRTAKEAVPERRRVGWRSLSQWERVRGEGPPQADEGAPKLLEDPGLRADRPGAGTLTPALSISLTNPLPEGEGIEGRGRNPRPQTAPLPAKSRVTNSSLPHAATIVASPDLRGGHDRFALP